MIVWMMGPLQVRQKLKLEAVAGSDASVREGQRLPKLYLVHGSPEADDTPGAPACIIYSTSACM